MNAANFFVSSFRDALNEKTEESFRSIMTEPSPGIFVFEMLQPRFCEKLLAEVSADLVPLFCMLAHLVTLFSYKVLIA